MSNKVQYEVLNGIEWFGGNRAEPGEIRDDIPKKSVPWLLEQGIIKPYDPEAATEPSGADSDADAAPDAPADAEASGDTTEDAPVDSGSGEG